MDVSWLRSSPWLLLLGAFAVRFVFWTWVERKRPAYAVDFKAHVLSDLGTTAFLAYVTAPAAERITNRLPNPLWIWAEHMSSWPLILRVSLYLVLADLGHYWVHRVMHMPLLWRIHKWHHSPTHMTWLSGNRESFFDRLLVSLPYVFLWPLLSSAPWWMSVALLMFAGVKNDWMHLNRLFDARWIEWLIVTPRYHHIHHSADSAHYTKNLAPLFSVWDRLFGTYYDPAKADPTLTFGTGGEEVPLVRLVSGL